MGRRTGKTAMAGAIDPNLDRRSAPHCGCRPRRTGTLRARRRPGQPGFHDRLRFQNLIALWATFRSAGARFIVVAGVVEHPALRKSYADCLPGCDVQRSGWRLRQILTRAGRPV
jgi:hypothetical protein